MILSMLCLNKSLKKIFAKGVQKIIMEILQSATTKLNNKIELYGEDKQDNNVLVIGVFHGDEPQGKYLIEKYIYSPSPSFQASSPQRGEGKRFLHTHNYTNFANSVAKELRKNSTDAERILWSILKNGQFFGLHFKRQQPIGNYIADFACMKKKIIIELDGSQHDETKSIEYDRKRTQCLNSLGFQVIRIWNNDIFNNLNGVYEHLFNILKKDKNIKQKFLRPLGERMSVGQERGYIQHNKLLFLPCLNPDGMQNNTRTNSNGVDLNRNYPTKNWGQDTSAAGNNPADYFGGKSAGSEIETKFVLDIIEKYKPKLILALHAPYKVVNYDGPAEKFAKSISKIIGYPVEASIGYPTPGSFGTYCGVERNIPTITLELDEEIPIAQLEQPVFEIFDYLSDC